MTTHPTLQKFDGSAIPDELKKMRRWAPWKAVYNAERGKWDKIPKHAKTPEYGISTASPEKWFTHDEALRAYIKHPDMLAGIGFVMTGVEGLTGIDLDGCLNEDGSATEWAQGVIKSLGSYTEISPSGRGLRVFVQGLLDGPDWTNHEVGIEVYGGSTPRFLTVSGRRYKDSPASINPVAPGVLAGLRGQFGRASNAAQLAKKDIPPMPEVLPELDTPSLHDIELPPKVRDFLQYGEHSGDRSLALHGAGVALYSAGLTDSQVFSVFVHSHHAVEAALDKRKQDTDRALEYIWIHQCVRAKPKARSRALSEADFDDLEDSLELPADDSDEATPVGSGAQATGDFGDLPDAVGGGVPAVTQDAQPKTKHRFEIRSAVDYAMQVKRLQWFIKGVLPKADISAIFGASGSGKTFAALDMAARIALGMDWFGIPCRRAKVLYIAAEGASGMRDRLHAWCVANNTPIEALDGWLFILGDAPNLIEKEDVKALVASARAQCAGVELVFGDTMAQMTPGSNENSGEDMGRFLGHCKSIGKALKAMVALVGHSGKDGSKGLRGWSGLKGALDSECEVIRTAEFRALTVTKLKDGKGEGMEYRFTLDEVVIDFDLEDGDVSSCVVNHQEVFAESGAKDIAQTEQAEKRKTERTKAKATGKKQTCAMQFFEQKASKDGHRMNYETALAELKEHLVAEKWISVADVTHGNAKSRTREVVSSLEKRGFLTIEGEILVVKNTLGAPDDCQI